MTARILVVDDVEANVRLLEAKLTIEYYEVLTAQDGATALEIAAAERPDIILLDVMMPGMDGFETCRRLKADPVTRHIPVVAVTAFAMKGDEERIRQGGCEAYISKPISVVHFLEVVRKHLDQPEAVV